MDYTDGLSTSGKTRIVQELVPGKQVTIAHLIANPDEMIYKKLGLDPAIDYSKSAIGILTVSPAETAIIAADLATKAAGIDLSFVDRFSGTLVITGSFSETEAAMRNVLTYLGGEMDFAVCDLTRT
jgi:Ethanolamine utilization protein